MSLFSVGIGIITFRSPKLKLRHLNAKLVGMPSSLGYLMLFSISWVLTPYIGNGSFYSFEAMVIRFLIELESSNLDHQNLSLPKILNHSIWISETQLTEKKTPKLHPK